MASLSNHEAVRTTTVRGLHGSAHHEALALPDVVAAFKRLGADPWIMGPREVTDYVVKEKARWAPIVLESGARVN